MPVSPAMHIPYQSALAYTGANIAGDTKYVYTQALGASTSASSRDASMTAQAQAQASKA